MERVPRRLRRRYAALREHDVALQLHPHTQRVLTMAAADAVAPISSPRAVSSAAGVTRNEAPDAAHSR